MRIVVTGATGFVGRRLLRALAAEGHELVGLTRSVHKARAESRVACKFHYWDAEKEIPSKQALEGADALVHLAGEGVPDERWTSARKSKIRDSRVKGTEHLVAGLERMERKPAVLLSSSAVGYYGDRGDEVLTEKSGPGGGFLSEICLGWESAISRGELGLSRRVIFRFGAVLGLEGGLVAKLLPVFKSGLGGPAGDGKQWVSWIHADDLVSLLVRALNDSAFEGTLNATSPNPVTNAELSKSLGEALGKTSFLRTPSFALKLALGEMAQEVVLASQRALPERALQLGFRFRYPEIGEAFREVCDNQKKLA